MNPLSRAWSARKAAGVVVILAAFATVRSATAGIGGCELVVCVQVPAEATGASVRKTVETAISDAASLGADGVLLVIGEMSEETGRLIGLASDQAKKHGLALWIGTRLPRDGVADLARKLKPRDVAGLALIFPEPEGEPLPPDKFAELMRLKKEGLKLGDSVRKARKELGPRKKLAVCVPASEMLPETARAMFVPVGDLVRDGTVDVVCLGGAEGYNFHRLRLLRDTPLRAGMFVDGGSAAGRAVIGALQNDTCECLWLCGFPVGTLKRVVPATVQGLKQQQQQHAAIERALADGRLAMDRGVSEKKCNDQATVHGVGQSFVPTRDGECSLVQLYAAIRGCRGALPPPLAVEIRTDGGGKPGAEVCGKTEIPAGEFGHEPAYRWVSAQFDPPVRLERGKRYWIYLPNASHPEGTYVWRIIKDAATEWGNAWSRRYDYSKHLWVFRVFLMDLPPGNGHAPARGG